MKTRAQIMQIGTQTFATAALAIMALALAPASLQAKVIKVPSKAIQTIQQGVDAAAPGDTVLVLPGTYVCSDVTDYYPPAVQIPIDKQGLRLKAAGPVQLVGPGGGTQAEPRKGTAIRIEADNVSVEGFDISGFGKGIVATGSYVWNEVAQTWDVLQMQGTQISRNTIRDCSGSCIVVAQANNCEVAHNTLDGGISCISIEYSPQLHVHHNRVTAAQGQWVLTEWGWQYWGGEGIMVGSSPGCRVQHNESNNNGQLGIYLAGSPDCTADNNQANNNGTSEEGKGGVGTGIIVLESPNCAVTGNETSGNVQFGIWVGTSCGSNFERNVAEGNGQWDLFAPNWGSDPACNTYRMNQGVTAVPSLATWDVRSAE